MLNPLDFSLEETESLLELAADIEKDRFPIRTCMRRKEISYSLL